MHYYGVPTATLLVGLPGVGKTYYAKQEDLNRVSSDDFIEDEANRLNKTYSEVFEDTIKKADSLFWEKIKTLISVDVSFAADRTFLTSKSRERLLDIVPDYWKVQVIEFQLPEDKSVWYKDLDIRSKKEGKNIPQHVLEKMMVNYEPVSSSERFDNHIIVKHYSER